MPLDTPEDSMPPENQDNAPETADVSTSFFGDKAPAAGDTCQVKVVSVDENSGMATIQYLPKPMSKKMGIAEAAEKFNEPEEAQ